MHHRGAGHLYGTSGGFSVAQAAEAVDWLVGYLQQRDVVPAPGSPFERATLVTWEMADKHIRGEAAASGSLHSSLHSQLADLSSITELAFALRAIRKHAEADRLLPLLKLLGEPSRGASGPEIGEVARPDRSGNESLDTSADKLFELLIACFALRVGSDLELDDGSAPGRNPDVLITLNGIRWGFACKTMHSDHPEAFASRLKEGAEQIYRSPARAGSVLFSIRTRLDAARLWGLVNGEEEGEALAYEDDAALVETVRHEASQFFAHAVHALGYEQVAELLRGPREGPHPGRPMWGMQGFGFYVHALGPGLTPEGGARVTTIRYLDYPPAVQLSQRQSRAATWGVTRLNHAAQLCLRSDERE